MCSSDLKACGLWERLCRSRSVAWSVLKRQEHSERGSLADLRLDFDGASVDRGDPGDKAQAQSQAFDCIRVAAAYAIEAIEDMRQIFCRDADASIFNLHNGVGSGTARTNLNASQLRCVFQSIRSQIGEQPFDLCAVALNGSGLRANR